MQAALPTQVAMIIDSMTIEHLSFNAFNIAGELIYGMLSMGHRRWHKQLSLQQLDLSRRAFHSRGGLGLRKICEDLHNIVGKQIF